MVKGRNYKSDSKKTTTTTTKKKKKKEEEEKQTMTTPKITTVLIGEFSLSVGSPSQIVRRV